jgi:hypothetical protein
MGLALRRRDCQPYSGRPGAVEEDLSTGEAPRGRPSRAPARVSHQQ